MAAAPGWRNDLQPSSVEPSGKPQPVSTSDPATDPGRHKPGRLSSCIGIPQRFERFQVTGTLKPLGRGSRRRCRPWISTGWGVGGGATVNGSSPSRVAMIRSRSM